MVSNRNLGVSRALLRKKFHTGKNKQPDAAFLARVALLKKKLAKPHLTKSVRERATEKEIAS